VVESATAFRRIPRASMNSGLAGALLKFLLSTNVHCDTDTYGQMSRD
jgi:hypothetical protein